MEVDILILKSCGRVTQKFQEDFEKRKTMMGNCLTNYEAIEIIQYTGTGTPIDH